MIITETLTINQLICPLCSATQNSLYHQDKNRPYYQCQLCQLVFVPPLYHLTPEQEKAEYDKHQNSPYDTGYRQFLSRTIDPLLVKLNYDSQGLDFGCGPGPCVSEILKEQGIKVSNYDLYYFNRPVLLEKTYDFVTMTEVIEHLSEPQSVLKQLKSLLKPYGILAIMTKRVGDQQAFTQWHYKNDPTHIGFYSVATFEWIAAKLGWSLEIIDKDVVFLHNR